MNENMKNALLQVYKNLDAAGKQQIERGNHDQGARGQVTSGKHMDSVAEVIKNDLIENGYSEESVYYKGRCLGLPGWFRPSKKWDMFAFDGDDLLAIIELKSINSSFGNNFNNRVEESLGSAVDISRAIKYELMPPKARPPMLGYVLVVKLCEESTRATRDDKKTIYSIDPAFSEKSYFERLTIMCRKLLTERIYQAVWIVGVNPETSDVIEPEPNLTYDKFLAALISELDIQRA